MIDQVSGVMVESDHWCQSSYILKNLDRVNLKCYQFSCEGDTPSGKGDLKGQVEPSRDTGEDRGGQGMSEYAEK